MNAVLRLTVAAMACVVFLGAARPACATDLQKQPAKTAATKTQASAPALGQAVTIKAQNPAGPSSSTRPNEQTKAAASAGWDTKATDKGTVKASDKRTDQATLIRQGNEQHKQEQLRLAQRYPATGKAPPSPPSEQPAKTQQPASGARGFFNRIFGKTN